MTDVNAYYGDELAVATYDLLAGRSAVAAAGDVAFYLACARQFGDPVLELAVGTGRVAWRLADAGLCVVGVDLSAAMLEQATQKGAGRPPAVRNRVTFHQADMTAFSLAASFPLAIIPYSAFQHLVTSEQQRAALACIRRHLLPGGHLVVDVFDPLLEHCIPGASSPIPDREVVSDHCRTVSPRAGQRGRRGRRRDGDIVRGALGLPPGDGVSVRAVRFRRGRSILGLRSSTSGLRQATDLGPAPALSSRMPQSRRLASAWAWRGPSGALCCAPSARFGPTAW